MLISQPDFVVQLLCFRSLVGSREWPVEIKSTDLLPTKHLNKTKKCCLSLLSLLFLISLEPSPETSSTPSLHEIIHSGSTPSSLHIVPRTADQGMAYHSFLLALRTPAFPGSLLTSVTIPSGPPLVAPHHLPYS